MTPLCFASLHLHQVGGGTFTLPDKARARHARIRPGVYAGVSRFSSLP